MDKTSQKSVKNVEILGLIFTSRSLQNRFGLGTSKNDVTQFTQLTVPLCKRNSVSSAYSKMSKHSDTFPLDLADGTH